MGNRIESRRGNGLSLSSGKEMTTGRIMEEKKKVKAAAASAGKQRPLGGCEKKGKKELKNSSKPSSATDEVSPGYLWFMHSKENTSGGWAEGRSRVPVGVPSNRYRPWNISFTSARRK